MGTQLPFDRLVRAVDCAIPGIPDIGVAQIGKGSYRPLHLEVHNNLSPLAFEALLGTARVVVAHAGIGTLLMAQKMLKPIIICPRRADLGEHRNDHQMATARALRGRPGIYIAWSEDDVAALLLQDLAPPSADPLTPARDRLNAELAAFFRRSG